MTKTYLILKHDQLSLSLSKHSNKIIIWYKFSSADSQIVQFGKSAKLNIYWNMIEWLNDAVRLMNLKKAEGFWFLYSKFKFCFLCSDSVHGIPVSSYVETDKSRFCCSLIDKTSSFENRNNIHIEDLRVLISPIVRNNKNLFHIQLVVFDWN